MNFYAVLGISRDADDDAIRRAYRVLVRRYHPDQGIGSSAEKFREVREAYETLIDPVSRRSYDLCLQRGNDCPAIRIEPIAAQYWPSHREDPSVFGRFDPAVEPLAYRNQLASDDILTSWLRALQVLFDEDEWP